jgi:thymidine phosphorylase
MELLLPFDFEPCMNHEARLMADEMVKSGECLNWDHAYECAWNVIEVEEAS